MEINQGNLPAVADFVLNRTPKGISQKSQIQPELFRYGILLAIMGSCLFFRNGTIQNAFAQPPSCLWAASGFNGGDYDEGYDICTDAAGNVMITGFYNSPILDFGPFTLDNLSASCCTADVFVVKYDVCGDVLWARGGGGLSGDWANSIATDAGGNIFITGYFHSPEIIFGSDTLINSGSGTLDIFIVKYDAGGNVVWAKGIGGSSDDLGGGIATDASGNILVTGYYGSSPLAFGTYTLTGKGVFTVKYDTAGNVLWAKSSGGPYNNIDLGSIGGDISADAGGNVIITGHFYIPSVTFGTYTLNNPSYNGGADLFVVKYDVNGNIVWAKSAGGSKEDMSTAVSTDAAGNILLTGFFKSSSIDFDSQTLTNADNSGSTSDAFVVKYDPGGNALWARSAGGTSDDHNNSMAICTDTGGNVLAAGNFGSPLVTFGPYTLINADSAGSSTDAFVVKYDPAGNVLWARSDGGTDDEKAMGISVDIDDNVLVTGMFKTPQISFGGSCSLIKSLNSAASDVFVTKWGEWESRDVVVSLVSGTNPACQGASVTFTATPTNGGSAPAYQWYVNGTPQTGQTGQAYTTASLNSGDTVVCIMNISGDCISYASEAIYMVILPIPSVSISIVNTMLCQGDSISFTATSSSSEATTGYQWRVNGTNMSGAVSSAFTSPALVNGDMVSVVRTTNSACGPSVTSNSITVNLPLSVTASASIASSPDSAVCQGTIITFTATAVYGGYSPSYQWMINGINAGTNSDTFTTSQWSDGDVVTLAMTSSLSCASAPTVTSNPITLTAMNPTPTVTISASDTSVCMGDSVIFTATPVNGGTSPTYQWNLNGANAGVNAPVFTAVLINDPSIVSVTLNSFHAACSSSLSDVSNPISVTVIPPVTASVSISSSTDSVCAGASVTFTATPFNPGSNPRFQWQIDGTVVANTNSATFSTSSLTDGQAVLCNITPECGTGGSSNPISVQVTPISTMNPFPDFVVCGGNLGATNFTSIPPGASFDWINSNTAIGLPAAGMGNVPAFTAVNASELPLIATITVTPTLNNCPGIPSGYDITVNPTPVIIQNGNVLTTSSIASNYQWYLDNVPIIGANGPTYTVTQNGNYSLEVGAGDCPSDALYINNVGKNEWESESSVAIYPNPSNGVFRINYRSIKSKSPLKLEVSNAQGKLLLTDVFAGENYDLDLSKQTNGVYFIYLRGEMGIKRFKISLIR